MEAGAKIHEAKRTYMEAGAKSTKLIIIIITIIIIIIAIIIFRGNP